MWLRQWDVTMQSSRDWFLASKVFVCAVCLLVIQYIYIYIYIVFFLKVSCDNVHCLYLALIKLVQCMLLSWMGLYGARSPKLSYLLGSPLGTQWTEACPVASAAPSKYVFNSDMRLCLEFVRSWIHRLRGTMSNVEKLALPCYADGTEFKMVNHYMDRDGCKRVWGP